MCDSNPGVFALTGPRAPNNATNNFQKCDRTPSLLKYEKYEQDLHQNEEVWDIFQEIRQNDEEDVQRLRGTLQQLIGSGSESEEEAA